MLKRRIGRKHKACEMYITDTGRTANLWPRHKCIWYHLLSSECSALPKGRSFTANSGTKAAVLPKGRSSTANSGPRLQIYYGLIDPLASYYFPQYFLWRLKFLIHKNLYYRQKILYPLIKIIN